MNKITLVLKDNFIVGYILPAVDEKDLKTNNINFSIDDNTSIEKFLSNITLNKSKLRKIADNRYELYQDGTIYQDPISTEKKYQNELTTLLNWFDEYDMQVKQYERDVRTKQTPFIHIDNTIYGSLAELDGQAIVYQRRIKELRKILGR